MATKTIATSNGKPTGAKAAGKIAETARKNLREELEVNFGEFLNNGWAEELFFIKNVLEDRSGTFDGFPRQPGEHEVPLFSAIEINLTGRHCIPVPEELIGSVEEFIESHKDQQREPTEALPAHLHKRQREILLGEVQKFITTAEPGDVFDMMEIFSRYKDFMEYDKAYRPDEVVKSAAQATIDSGYALLKVSWGESKYETTRTLAKIVEGDTWLSGFLKQIVKSHADDPEALTPCNIAADAQKQQAKFDADVKKARQLKKDFPKLVA